MICGVFDFGQKKVDCVKRTRWGASSNADGVSNILVIIFTVLCWLSGSGEIFE